MITGFFEGIATLHAAGLMGKGVRVGHLDSGLDPQVAGIEEGRLESFLRVAPGGFESAETAPGDGWGHGTMTAGMLAASRTGSAPFGVAPEATLLSAAVIEEGNALARVLHGIDWLVLKKPSVVLLSLGFVDPSPALVVMIEALLSLDILVVAASGNQGAGRALWPANCPGVLSVGSADKSGMPLVGSASRSWPPRQGRACVPHVLGPGHDVAIRPLRRQGLTTTGTSIAAAAIAGLAAILRGAHPNATARQVHAAILGAAPVLPDDFSHRTCRGLPDPVLAASVLEERSGDFQIASPDALFPVFVPQTPICDVIACFDNFERCLAANLAAGHNGLHKVVVLKHRPIAFLRVDREKIPYWIAVDGISSLSSADAQRIL